MQKRRIDIDMKLLGKIVTYRCYVTGFTCTLPCMFYVMMYIYIELLSYVEVLSCVSSTLTI